MRYLRLFWLTPLFAACASDPPPRAESGEQFATHDEQSWKGPAAPPESNARAQDLSDPPAVQANVQPQPQPQTQTQPVAAKTTSDADRVAAVPVPSASASAPMSTAVPVSADNTAVNKRDKSGDTLTPLDQGGSESDRKITQLVRQAVMKDGSLSFTAKNVKIITQDGKITLRGPVNSTAERSTIENAARNVAGVTRIDNLLEVKQ